MLSRLGVLPCQLGRGLGRWAEQPGEPALPPAELGFLSVIFGVQCEVVLVNCASRRR